jgi:hypothetical protein
MRDLPRTPEREPRRSLHRATGKDQRFHFVFNPRLSVKCLAALVLAAVSPRKYPIE